LSVKSHPPKTEVFVGHFRRATLGEVISVQNSIMSAQKKKRKGIVQTKTYLINCFSLLSLPFVNNFPSSHWNLVSWKAIFREKCVDTGTCRGIHLPSDLLDGRASTFRGLLRMIYVTVSQWQPFHSKSTEKWVMAKLHSSQLFPSLSSGAFCCLIIPSKRPDREKRYPTNSGCRTSAWGERKGFLLEIFPIKTGTS
ncbi:hypothetical protein CDAR_504891, partial [Caerostris darwini]